jgi:hypothetical protein
MPCRSHRGECPGGPRKGGGCPPNSIDPSLLARANGVRRVRDTDSLRRVALRGVVTCAQCGGRMFPESVQCENRVCWIYTCLACGAEVDAQALAAQVAAP